MKTLSERVEGVREALENMHSDDRLTGGKYEYQLGFLDALGAAKSALQSLPGAEMTEDDLVAIVMNARMQSKVDLPVSIRETIRVLNAAGVILVKS
jgi:hypothetical protein